MTVAIALLSTAALGQDRFAPGNPWFQDFEATCRIGSDLNAECQVGVLKAYMSVAGANADVRCDFAKFWQVRDDKFANSLFAVLPWQTLVEYIVAEPGVCWVAN